MEKQVKHGQTVNLSKARDTIEVTFKNYDFGLHDGNGKMTDNVMKSNKCNLCDFTSSHKGNLRTHLKMHSVES